MARKIDYTVGADFDGRKIKSFLRGGAGISYRLMKSLKTYDNGILLNGEHARVIDTVKTGDIITVNIPDKTSDIEPIDIPLDIIYEDDDFVVINKSPFLAMHPTHNHQGDTLANALCFHLQKENKPTVFHAVGRLDKGTSGIVVCALNSHAAAAIPKSIKKEYLAVVCGKTQESGTIDIPIYRPDPMKTLRKAGEHGDRAVTHYEKIKGNDTYSFLKIRLETGRTHQIRVHFSHMGHPVAGDKLYGPQNCEFKLAGQLLHAYKLTLTHPRTGELMEFTAPLPEHFTDVLKRLDAKNGFEDKVLL